MANELKVKVSAETKEAEQGLVNVQTKVDKVAASNDNLSKKQGTLAGQLRSTTREIQKLELEYAQLSEADKNATIGNGLKAKLSELYQTAGQLQDIKADVQANINNLASDTANWDAVAQGINVAKDSITGIASAFGIAAEDGSLMADTLNTIARVQGIANAAITIGNALQKQSALMIGIRNLQSKLSTAATTANTIATTANTTATTANATAAGAATTAIVAETTATQGATVAQSLFNAVAAMNPYVLLAMAVVGAGAAILGFTAYLNSETEEEKKAQAEAEKLKEAHERLQKEQEELNKVTGTTAGKFEELKIQWGQLKTEAEKTKFIEQNKSAFQSLGLAINDTNTAQKIFVDNSDAMCKALIQQAVAAKQAEVAIQRIMALETKRATKSVKTGDYYTTATESNVTDEERRAVGAGKHTGYTQNANPNPSSAATTSMIPVQVWDKLTKEQLDQVNKMRQEDARRRRKAYDEEIDYEISREVEKAEKAYKAQADAIAKANSIAGKVVTGPNATTTPTKTPKTSTKSGKSEKTDEEKQDEALKSAKEKYAKALENAAYNYAQTDKGDDATKEYKEALKSAAGTYMSTMQSTVDLSKASSEVQQEYLKIYGEYNNLKEEIKQQEEATKSYNESLKNAGKQIEKNAEKAVSKASESYSNPTKSQNSGNKFNSKKQNDTFDTNSKSIDDNNKKLDELQSKISETTEAYNKLKQAAIDKFGSDAAKWPEDATKALNELNTTIEESSSQFESLKDTQESLIEAQNELNNSFDLQGGIADAISGINDFNSELESVADGWTNMAESWEDMDSMEQAAAVINNISNSFQQLSNAIGTVQKLCQAFGQIGKAATAASQASQAAATGEMTAESGKALASGAAAMGKAAESGASMPFPANIAAIAAGVAAVTAVIATIISICGSFAGGGIIEGASSIGDMNLARVNAGELILNNRQQANLFRALDTGNGLGNDGYGYGSNEVEFVISGSNLIGTVNNINNIERHKLGGYHS